MNKWCVFLLLFGLFGWTPNAVMGQNLQELEIAIGEKVTEWQNAVGEADVLRKREIELLRQYAEIQRALDWVNENYQTQVKIYGSKRDKRSAIAAIKSAKKKLTAIQKEIEVTKLKATGMSEYAESVKKNMRQLIAKRDYVASTGDRNHIEKIHSGFFPSFDDFYRYSKDDDLLINPPEYSCEFAFKGTDPLLNKLRRDLRQERFFVHQPTGLYFDKQLYLTCKGHVSLIEGGLYFLNLEYYIASENYREEFGFLDRGSRLILYLINGDEITMQNKIPGIGTFDKTKGQAKYRAQYALRPYEIDKLSNHGIDKVRVEWTKGYDDYPVFNTDFLRNQLDCL